MTHGRSSLTPDREPGVPLRQATGGQRLIRRPADSPALTTRTLIRVRNDDAGGLEV